jgi:glucose/arabinose dehydrogenase
VLSRFSVGASPDVADPAETVILTVAQPSANHNGGTVAFGPDGFLYLGLGDGGGSGSGARAQDPQQLLGKMLRLDVGVPFAPGSTPVPGTPYAIPADNPFAATGDGVRDEIASLGLRNPFRFSFDRNRGDLWIGDVGQTQREEVDFAPAGPPGGRNFGWSVMEGSLCLSNFPPPAPPCNDPSLSLPLYEYDHSAGDCAITGGVVYRGSRVPAAQGLYFFGDYCTGRVWTLDPATLDVADRTAELAPAAGATQQLVAFAEDGQGELLLVGRASRIYRLVPRTPCNDGVDNDGDALVDFPADPGCRNGTSPKEAPACNDGLDNDQDGRIDLADPDCLGDPARDREFRCGQGAALALFVPLALAALRRRRAAGG